MGSKFFSCRCLPGNASGTAGPVPSSRYRSSPRNQAACAFKGWPPCRELLGKATPAPRRTSPEGRCIESSPKDVPVHKAVMSGLTTSLTNT